MNSKKSGSLLGGTEIVRDHEIQLRRTDGSVVWCSTNCRRGFYSGRPALIIGVLDITERKQREDLFGFLIRNHPLPVWMCDAATGEIIYQSDAADRLLGLSERNGGPQRASRLFCRPRTISRSWSGNSWRTDRSKIAKPV